MKRHAAMVIAALGLLCSAALALSAQPENQGDAPKSYAECVAAIYAKALAIDMAAAAGDLRVAGSSASQMTRLSKSLAGLALADAAVARDAVKTIEVYGKELSEAAEAVRVAAEARKVEEAKAGVAALKSLVHRLDAIATEVFVCPMHCEGTRTYAGANWCPVCKMALTPLSKTPYYAQVSAEGTVEAGKPATLAIRLLDPAGNPATKVDVVHEHPLHFIIVSEDLSFYAHEHPTRQADGTFRLPSFVFPFGGKFLAYSDFTPTGADNQVSSFEFKIADGSVPKHEPVKLVEDFDGVGKSGDYEFRVRCNGQMFTAGQDSFLRYGIDLKGEPVKDLEPIMGAMGHLVLISKDGERYIHAHPLDFSAKPAGDSGSAREHRMDAAIVEKGRESLLGNGKPSDVVFHAVFPAPGLYRGFAQFQHKGRVLMYAVTIDARPDPNGSNTPVKAGGVGGGGHDHRAHGLTAPANGAGTK